MSGKKQSLFDAPSLQNKPSDDVIEVTLFGKGVGECIVMHLGFGRYVTIDSFINSETNRPVALDYLESMNVSADSIDCVAVTHWHKDHVLGIAELVKSVSSSARFVMPAVVNDECFTKFVEVSDVQLKGQSPAAEFHNALRIIKERKLKIVLATNDKLILGGQMKASGRSKQSINLYSLSPNDEQMLEYLTYLKSLTDKVAQRPTYTFAEENNISTALWLDFVMDKVLLGGDLETDGWNAIVNDRVVAGKASLFKVPHHGSVTAHLDSVWTEMLIEKPVSMLSVFSPSGLPNDEDKRRIKERSKLMVVAGERVGIMKRPGFFKKLNKCSSVQLSPLDTNIGMVRARKPISGTLDWTIECFGKIEGEVA